MSARRGGTWRWRRTLAVVLASGCGDPRVHEGAGASVAIVPAPQAPECVYAGVLVPRQAIDVFAPSAGEVLELPAETGQAVGEGDAVAVVHDSELAHDLVDARAALQRARAKRRRSEAELHRTRHRAQTSEALGRIGHLSENEVTDATLAAETAALERTVAQAEETAAASMIQRLDGRRDRHVLRAPWPARVAERRVEIGARVERGAPLLRLVDAGPPRVRFGVSPSAASDLAPGTLVHLRLEGGGAATARVRHAGTVQDLGTLVVTVEAELVEDLADLRPGLAAWIHRPGEEIACTPPAVSVAAIEH